MILRKIIARWLAACQAGGRVPQLPSLVVNCGTDLQGGVCWGQGRALDQAFREGEHALLPSASGLPILGGP